MRDIILNKCRNSKHRKQYKVQNDGFKCNTRSSRGQKVVMQKKKINAEKKAIQISDELQLISMFGKKVLSNCNSMLLKLDLTLYKCNNGMSFLGDALIHCIDTTGPEDEVPCPSVLDRFILGLLWLEEVLEYHERPRDILYYLFRFAEDKYSDWKIILGNQQKSLNLQNAAGNTLLHYACKYDRHRAVLKLMKVQGCSQMKNTDGEIPLHIACREGNFKIVKLLLAGEGEINGRNNSGDTPLLLAYKYNNLELFPALLEHGADINICNNNGMNALAIASFNGETETALSLLNEYNMKIENCNIKGVPLLVALIQKLSKDLLTDRTNNIHKLRSFLTLMYNNYDDMPQKMDGPMLTSLIDHCEQNTQNWMDLIGGDPKFLEYQCKKGYTLLHYVCRYQKQEAFNQFLKCGVNPNKASNDGNTVLHICSRYDYSQMALMLVNMDGCDINQLNKDRSSPLAFACRHGSTKTAEILLRHGARFINFYEHIECSGQIPLAVAQTVCTQSPEIVPLLLHYGLPVNYKWNNKYPLDDIIAHQQPSSYLIRGGIYFARPGERGKIETYREIIQYMISAGAITTDVKLMAIMEKNFCSDKPDEYMINFLLESGYKFHISLNNCLPDNLQDILNEPLSLQALSGHKIRSNLFPNAWFSAFKLPIPKCLQDFVVMQFCGRDYK